MVFARCIIYKAFFFLMRIWCIHYFDHVSSVIDNSRTFLQQERNIIPFILYCAISRAIQISW